MEATGQELEEDSSVQILSLLISDFLSPIKPSHSNRSSRIEDPLSHKIKPSGAILLKIVRNALRSHKSEMHRKIRLSNPKIQNMVFTVPYAVDLLTAVGFVYLELDGEKFLMFSENDNNVATANLFCSVMEEELNSLEPPSFAAGTHSFPAIKTTNVEKRTKNISQDTFLSEKERKERTLKVKRAKRAKQAEKNLAIQRWVEDNEARMEKQKRESDRKNEAKSDKKDNETFDASPYVNIRKLQEGSSKESSLLSEDKDESLDTLRARAANAWRLEQNHSNNSIDIDINATAKDAVSMPDKKMVSELNLDESSMSIDMEDAQDLKPAAKPAGLSDPMISAKMQPSWEDCMENLPRCGPASGIRETSVFKQGSNAVYSSSTQTCLKRLFTEFEELKTSLPSNKLCSAWLRFDEESPQFIRALLTAPLPGPSPYAGGVFAFDIMIPDNYPNVSPKVNIVTTGRGKIRFGPNLYACGKVCLSLLGTWEGPKWDPKNSSLFQVLVSIQSLMLGVEHPYFLEPGHGGWEEKVKEGDFTSVGQTLSGQKVKEDLTLPSHAWIYEDKIRVGALRFAMLEPLEMICRQKDSVKPSLAHLLPFESIIKLHFSHNSANVLRSVADWINSSRPSTMSQSFQQSPTVPSSRQRKTPSKLYPVEFVNTLNNLFLKFEAQLEKVPEIELPFVESPSESADTSMKLPAEDSEKITQSNNLVEEESLYQRMKEAAGAGNFILAGQLQKEIQALESFDQKIIKLSAEIKKAASEGDYIRAGELQNDLKNLQRNPANIEYSYQPAASETQIDSEDEQMQSVEEPLSDEDDGSDIDYDEVHNSVSNKWGAGYRLDEVTSSASKQPVHEAVPNNISHVSVPRLPIKKSCRLRIRLPSSSIVEEFDCNEKLTVVYKVVKSHMPTKTIHNNMSLPRLVQWRGVANAVGNQMVSVSGGAFASPASEFGFTLLSAHPKREYSLEMDGMASLQDLNMAPCATLSVMMCNTRGQVKRGMLENKLDGAEGDAMDVEDLGYEALQELGEKIGVAVPGDGEWKGINLDNISSLISPKDYLSQKTVNKKDSKCCICLGEFDPTEEGPQLRILSHCSHSFHSACLETWLSTKTNCPVCKHSLSTE